jgi:signal transduction histidine kinase
VLLRLAAVGALGGEQVAAVWRSPFSDRVYSVKVAPLRQARGSEQLLMLLLSDVTEAHRLQHEADLVKQEFFAMVSHELRTPLSAILGYLELMDEQELSPDGAHFATVIRRNATRLSRLVDDLLFAAQIETATLQLQAGAADAAQIAREACESARSRAHDAGVTVTCHAPESLPLVGDADRIAQAVDNLVANAIKFTGAVGGGEVRVTARAGGDEQDPVAVLEVSDTGPGIAADEQARLFESFYRARHAAEHAVQGVGLGLAITRAIAVGHGGELRVASVLGEGATFSITLPVGGAASR